tara:strand:- start:288 stop:887 length:600 start_codon:yes stop_codon:yes gene_type:complete
MITHQILITFDLAQDFRDRQFAKYGSIQFHSTITLGGLVDTINLGTTGAISTVHVEATAVDADVISNFVSGEDIIDLSLVMAPATLTVAGAALVVGGAANQGAGALVISTAANTDAPTYWIDNAAGTGGVQTLAQIEAAVAAGTGAVGEVLLLVDNGTNTLMYYDADANAVGGAAALILIGTLAGISSASVATGDFISV